MTIGAARERALRRVGVTVTDRYRAALLAGGHNAVYVEDEMSADIVLTPALTERTRAQATESLNKAFISVPPPPAPASGWPPRRSPSSNGSRS